MSLSYVYLLYTRAIYNKANVVCELWTFGKVLVMFSFFSISKSRSKQSYFRNG